MILRAVIVWASAASLMAALSYWQWGMASDRADKAEAALLACQRAAETIRRDVERDNEIDNRDLRTVPDGWLLDF